MKKTLIALGLVFAASQVNAAGMDAKQIYFGGGIGSNDAFGDSATGFQIFAGMPLPLKGDNKVKLSVEVGYMDSGDFEQSITIPFLGTITSEASASGLWGTAVASMELQDNLDLLGRVGYDIGDDDGIMFGAGIGYKISPKMEIRGEYVIRDIIDSLQVNLVFRQ